MRLPRLEWQPLAVLCLAAAIAWGFVELADEVLEGETREIDSLLLLALRSAKDPSDPLGPQWVEEMARDLTALGSFGVLALLTAAAVGYLVLAAKRHAAIAVLAAVAGGVVLSTALKLGFDRPRPDLVPHAVEVYTASFPSGHSMMAAVTYLTLGALLARVEGDWRLKLYWVGIALLLTLPRRHPG
jgi:undecaprenyl-diphosphatase